MLLRTYILTLIILICFGANQSFAADNKNKKGPSAIKKAYHDLTARYNYYFNAKMKLNESLEQLKAGNKDNYNELLTVKEYGDKDARSSISPAMDEVIKKSSIAIQLHKISKWVDDSYFLIGKAHFLKGDNTASLQTLQYIEKEFKDNYRKVDNVASEYDKELEKKDAALPKTDEQKQVENKRKSTSSKDKAKAARDRNKDRQKSAKERNKEKAKAAKQRAKDRKKGRSSSSRDKVKEVYEELETKEEKKKVEEEKAVEINNEVEPTFVSDAPFSQGEKKKKRFLGFLRHKRVNQEANLWLLENYLEMKHYATANEVIDILEADINFPKKLRDDLYALKSRYHIENENWEDATVSLDNAIDYSKKRNIKARYHFIKAQLNQQNQMYALANESFKKVLKNKPGYDMEFHTKLKLAETMMMADPSAKTKAVASLRRMLKDGKNNDYLDKIHFTLAEIELADGNTESAIRELKLAAENSTVDQNQKGLAFLKLAEIYFGKEAFTTSSAYYDSSVVFLSKDLEEYDKIVRRKDILKDLALHLNTIEFEDSLQQLAKMSPALRNEIIDEVIEKFESAAEDARSKEDEEKVDFSAFAQNNINPGVQNNKSNSAGGDFYFYNDASKARGFSRFKEKWGDRTLSDYWSISSKAGAGALTFGAGSQEDGELFDLAMKGSLTRDIFIAQLPMDAESKKASNEKIVEAMYQAGNIYKEYLDNNKKAKSTFNNLNRKYPKNKYDLESHYQLYLIAKATKNTAEMKKNKDYILGNFPDSQYAKLITDPNYAASMLATNNAVNKYYEQSFNLYKNENYNKVMERHQKVDAMFEDNPLKPQFDFLNAQSIGYTKEQAMYVSALQEIVVNHPNTEVESRSQEILALIKSNKLTPSGKEKAGSVKANNFNSKASPYKLSKNEKHYFIIAFPKYNAGVNKLMDNISNLNQELFSLEGYKTNQMLLDEKNQIVLVKTFKNGDKAMTYYNQVKEKEKDILSEMGDVQYNYFPISKNNFTTYFKQKKVADYVAFFEANYLSE